MKKLPYLDSWDVTPAEIRLTGGMSEDGEPELMGNWKGNVNFSEKVKRVQNADGLWVRLAAVIHVKGDILPQIVFREGTATIAGYDGEFTIFSYSRPRNPDGTVNHTRLELL